MAFKKYVSIENSYQKKTINKIVETGLSGGDWVVTEKVHGANFGFRVEGSDITMQKRTSDLKLTDKFYNSDSVYKKHSNNILSLGMYIQETKNRHTRKNYPDENQRLVKSVTFFGEIFGGRYPHDDVKSVINQTKVQNGVWYSPTNEFYLFDIMVTFVDESYAYLPYKEMMNYIETVLDNDPSFLVAQPLFIGSFDEALKFTNEFNTTIPIALGLPEIEDNICEGTVIKPYANERFLGNGSRVILKNKNKTFAERSSRSKTPKIRVEEVITPEMQADIDIVASFINANRLRNVLSKIGPVEAKDFSKIMKDFITDIKEDFEKEYDLRIYGAIYGKVCGKMAAKLIRENLIDIVNGDF